MTSPPQAGGPVGKIILWSSLAAALVISYHHASTFFDVTVPHISRAVLTSDLYAFEGLFRSLYFLISYPAFFLLSFAAVQLTLTVLLSFFLSRFL